MRPAVARSRCEVALAGAHHGASMSPARLLVAWLVFVALLARSGGGQAQSCHSVELRKPERSRFRSTLGLLAASYDSGDQAGEYQGLYAGFAYRADWIGAEVLLPAYRLSRSSGDAYGLGDLVLTARGTAMRVQDGAISAGVELPLLLPTGDSERELGIGGVMPMPGLWFALVRRPFSLRAQAGYGIMIGGRKLPAEHPEQSAGAMGASRHPIVYPINRSEFEHALTLGLGVARTLSVHARWFGALPIADQRGVARQILAAGATASLDVFDVTLELQRPVAGDPFDYKVVLQLGLSL